MTLKKVEEGIYAQESTANEIRNIDGIIFDCDGVLVDVSNSYDLAIQRTTAYILKEVAKISKFDPVTSKIIDAFKATGGFNDEVDLTYAAILSLAAANNLKKSGNQFVFEVIKNADQTGIKSVEKFLDNSNANITVLKKELLEILKKKLGKKIAIVSGRGIESIRYSLEELLDEFDIENSIFLEDESRELAKPNPNSLIRTFKGIGSLHCLYVGDSMEDFIMAQKATEMGNKITFCAIIGTSKYPEEKKKLFEEKNVPLILNSIDLLPKALNLV